VAREANERTGEAALEFDWPRYPRILVALDETPAALFALRHVVPYAVDQGSRLTLLTVVPHPAAGVTAAGVAPQQLRDELEEQAAKRLRRVTGGLPEGLPVTTVLRHGDPADEIMRLLDSEPFDLICMGARGRGRLSGAVLGSVSSAVLHRSRVPVVVLHPPAGG
jgi:nucleotide-binding universal stress UspA family protein